MQMTTLSNDSKSPDYGESVTQVSTAASKALKTLLALPQPPDLNTVIVDLIRLFVRTQGKLARANEGKAKKVSAAELSAAKLLLRLGERRSADLNAADLLLELLSLDSLLEGKLLAELQASPDSSGSVPTLFIEATAALLPKLKRGEVDDIIKLLDLTKIDYPDRYERIRGELGKLTKEVGLPSASQSLLAQFSDSPRASLKVSFSNEGQTVRAGQLAFALIASWKARAEGKLSEEAFEALRKYSEQFSALSLFGVPGEKTKYDGLVHYGNGLSHGEEVVVTRPGVKWTGGAAPEIILPANVKKP